LCKKFESEFERWNLTIWKDLKIFLLKFKYHDLAIGKVSYSKILGGFTLISQPQDPTVGFVNE